MDEVTIEVEARPETTELSVLEAEAGAITARIKQTIGITTRVAIQLPGTLERSAGKAQRVVDRRALPRR